MLFNSSQGEVLYLRTELTKRESDLERERSEKTRTLELKSAELKQMEEHKKAELEKMKTDQEFLKHDIERMSEIIRRREAHPEGSFSSPSFRKKAAIPEGIDE